MPSVGTLLRITRAIGISVSDLFEVFGSSEGVVRADERAIYSYPGLGFREARISVDPGNELQVVWVSTEPGGSSGSELFAHGSRVECVFVISGTLLVKVDEQEHELRSGDCLTFSGLSPHGYVNMSQQNAEVLWITCPATY